MENFYFKDIKMNAAHCVTADTVDGLNFENVRIKEVSGAGQAPRDSEKAKIYIAPEYPAYKRKNV